MLPLAACQSLMDLDITYQDCVNPPGKRYAEGFRGQSLQSLRDRCWQVANQGAAPSGVDKKIFVEDGDLVMRVDDASGSADLDQWTNEDQAPFVFRRLEGDFLVVVRAEASTKANGDHCLPAGNAAGLALRQADEPAVWTTWTVEPYLWVDGSKKADCKEDADETNNPTATVRLRSSNVSWPATQYDDVGIDGEADIAVCRVDDMIYYQYGKATADPAKNLWLPETPLVVSHAIGAGPLDVGVSTMGTAPSFQAAGHFNWIVFEHGTYGDGCSGALEPFTLPEDD